MRFLDLFAGIGGFRLALERAGHKCIGFCEIDKFARQTYKANFNTEGEVEWHDITKVTDGQARELRGKVDLITGGFPCQAFSVAGERRGFEDTRGTLFFEIARIAKEIEPRYLLLENVKGLLSHDKGRTFGIILNTLDELGFDCEWQLLNSKDFGVPQNRERVFIVGHSRRFPRREIFPITRTSGQTLKEITQGLADAYRVYDPAGIARTLKAEAGGVGAKTGLYIVPVLTLDRVEKRHGVLVGNGQVRIRRLTPLECFRLQGFPDEHFHNAKAAGVSDSQLYKQAGNAVTVNVVYEIARRLQND